MRKSFKRPLYNCRSFPAKEESALTSEPWTLMRPSLPSLTAI
jgi:hypothetical protein